MDMTPPSEPTSAAADGRAGARLRLGILVAALLGGVVALLAGAAPSATGVRELVESAPVAAPLVFVAVYALLTVGLVPGAIGSAAAGAIFGTAGGTCLVLAGATLGATGAFAVARLLGRDAVVGLAGRRALAADRWLRDRGLGGVLFLRLVPLFPFSAINYAAGLSGLRLRTYVVGTALGIAPGTVAYVGLGAGLDDPGSAGFLASLGLLAALTLAGFAVLRLARPEARP